MPAMLQVILIVCGVFVWTCESTQPCLSCGPECVSACGSRNYRACCFNYLRKRRSPPAAPPNLDADPPSPLPWHRLSLSPGSASQQSSALDRNREVQVELVLLPDRFAPEQFSRFRLARDAESPYQENMPLGRLEEFTRTPTTPPSSTDNPAVVSDVGENSSVGSNEVSSSGQERVQEAGHSRRLEAFPWAAENRRRLHLVYSA